MAISALVTGETVGPLRWFAVVLGFAGVLAVAWPCISVFTSEQLTTTGAVGLLFALGAIGSNVAANFAMRQMIGREGSETIAFYVALICSLVALLSAPFGWILPGVPDLYLLIAAGLAGALGQFSLAEALRNARMSIIAPFEYSSIVFATLAGMILFSEWPGINTLVGGAIVVVSGIAVVVQQSGPGRKR
ncbi:DMT family transporter [Paracoccus pantotrophus]|uniref:DMT family transporter n=1 Tax=Paracoccus pantotrophus TaxID=82367 RepID=UPI00048CEA33|nr:DMT family transporter [Paracoccus pantotrophus]